MQNTLSGEDENHTYGLSKAEEIDQISEFENLNFSEV